LTHPCVWGDSAVPVRGFSSIESYVPHYRFSQIGDAQTLQRWLHKIRIAAVEKAGKLRFLKNLPYEKDLFYR
jgi:hypothetical protein